MRICVTGAAGFIGSLLVPSLLEQGYTVTGLDNLHLGGQGLACFYGHPRFTFVKGSITDPAIAHRVCKGQEVVVHLAALVGEPPCNRNPDVARNVNFGGTINMLAAAREMGVQHFLFSSTCSNYGKQPGWELDETASLVPLSLYAETKIAAEREVMAANMSDFATTVFRFATAFGVSPRMRFDTMLNEFVRDAMCSWLLIYGKESYRTVVHVRDIVSMISLTIDKREEAAGQVFNVGGEHISKMGLVNIIKKYIPKLDVEFKDHQGDPRDYKANFKKALAFGYSPNHSIEDGVIEVKKALEDGLFADPFSSLYRNVQ